MSQHSVVNGGPVFVPDIPLEEPFDDYFLSSLTPSDFPRLVDLNNNTDLSRILFNPPYPYTLQDAQWFHDNRAHAPVPGFPDHHECWIIRCKSQDGILVGICSTRLAPGAPAGRLTVGYFVAPEFRGKGIVPVVVKEVCRQFPGATFDAEIEEGNTSSHKVMDKCGFTKLEGYVREQKWPDSKGGDVRKLWKFVKPASSGST
ncbi:hypothetical protein Dda_5689 [Drechslerella dactyloides]|uniref:N-acetyltransferase domain-containing protein n=1 Tax=Drechslerella dactyloides TaxID=74499 RepID=A0AAD6IWJ9_DREDA|nr:hypothetical protein Dda_5689 [Drechslerella dactyloides]